MTDVKLRDREPSVSLLFLRDEELRECMELFFFGYRDFTAEADQILSEIGFGRAHHRALHFIARNDGITINELLAILSITKQSLGRVIKDLMAEGLIEQRQGAEDKRYKHLHLTPTGTQLELRLSAVMKRSMGQAFRQAGADAVRGFKEVLTGLMNAETRALAQSRSAKKK